MGINLYYYYYNYFKINFRYVIKYKNDTYL